VLSRQTNLSKEEAGLSRQGTLVIVRSLFGDLPVRARRLSLQYSSSVETEKAAARLKEAVVGYSLAHSGGLEVRMTLHGEKQQYFRCNSTRPNGGRFDIGSIVSLLYQAKFVAIPSTKLWHSVSVRTSLCSIRAAISTLPMPSRSAQFISIGQAPVRRNRAFTFLFEIVDRLFEASRFGTLEYDLSDTGIGHRREGLDLDLVEFGRLGRTVDRFPSFYIQIDPIAIGVWPVEQVEHPAETTPFIEHLTKALESLINHFLSSSGLTDAGVEDPSEGAQRRRLQQESRTRTSWRRGRTGISHSATEARYLSHWNRVKSTHSSVEDLRYGLASGKLEVPIASLSSVHEHGCSGKKDLASVDDNQNADTDNDSHALTWTDPRTGRISHLNPRTGSFMPGSPSKEPCPQSAANAEKIRSPPDARTPVKLLSAGQTNLRKYLGNRAPQQETHISSMRFRESSGVNNAQPSRYLSKHALSEAKVIQQVDQKFILAVAASSSSDKESVPEDVIIAIDQHAADERVRYEQLCRELCLHASTVLPRPMIFEIQETEAPMFRERQTFFQQWCIIYALVQSQTWRLEVTTLPSLIAERCRSEPRILIDLLRRELWSGGCRPTASGAQPWYSEMAHCPEGMVQLLKSRSCRSAIMFNDTLDISQCRELVQNLSQCVFPFQCAHGRPTTILLLALADLDGVLDSTGKTAGLGYGDAWTDWIGDH
jgi:DNA mismatch repair protein MLH3